MDFEDQDIDENVIMPGGDYPPTDAINQMHRYRDAIYYSQEHELYRSKEIIGGYILFPGRGNDEYIKKRYYSNSIDSVNIGAFPLLPNSDTLVEEHLRRILMEYTNTKKHVETAKPQRTLAYVTEEEKAEMSKVDMVLLITKEGQHYDNAIKQLAKTRTVGVALKMDGAVLKLVEGFTKAKYLVIHNKSSKYCVYCFDGNGPKLIPGAQAEPMVVTKQKEDLYLVYQVDLEQSVDLGELDISIVAKGGDGYSPHLLPLSKLQKEEKQ